MRRLTGRGLAVLGGIAALVGVAVVPIRAASDPDDLLMASEIADQQVSYTGSKIVRVFQPGGASPARERVVKVWHRAPDQTRIEVLQPSESLGVIVVDSGEESWLFNPRAQRWQPLRRRPPQARPALLLRNYDVQLLRKERVAERRAFVLRVVSRHSGTLSKMVWVDVKTKLPLRQELYDATGNLAASSEYREVSYESSLPGNLFTLPQEVRMGQQPARSDDRDRLVAGAPVAQPRYVPQGYQLVSRMTVRHSGWEIGYLRWTDGLNTISLIQERGKHEHRERGQRSKAGGLSGQPGPRRKGDGARDEAGSSMHCGNRLVWTRNGSRFVLMGNVPLAELKRMAGSLADVRETPSRQSSAAGRP